MRFGHAAVIVVVGVAIVLFGVALLGIKSGLIEYTAVISIFGLVLTAWGIYLSRHPVPAPVPRAQQREHAVNRLAESVRVQWEEEAKVRGLADPEPMPVRWAPTAHDVTGHPHHIFGGRPGFDGQSDRIDDLAERFLALSRRRLVILGGPGSGKTTLAVQLLLRLLQVRTPTDPVPVLLTANSWDTSAHPRMQDWLASRLGKDYPALRAIDPAMPGELVDNGMVLPVIDGLDELDPTHRPVLLTTLNASLGATDPLVLTCRTEEFVDAVENADVLTAAAVIEAQSLSARAAADYLNHCLPPRQLPGWEPILDALRRHDDTPLANACRIPLGLWLLRTVHIENRSDPTPLLDPARYPDAEAIKAHLFDELIPAVINKRRPLRDGSDPLRPRRWWEPGATRQWLAYLALQLHGESDLRWWHLPATVPARVTTTLTLLAFGLVVGLGVGQVIWLEDAHAGGGMVALALGLAGALTFGLRSGRQVRRTLARELAFVLVFVPWVGLVFFLTGGLAGGLVVGPVFGLAFALAFGLAVGRQVRRTPEPGYANLRLRARGRDLARELAGGLAFGLGFGLAVGLTLELLGWGAFGLPFGMAVGLAGGLAVGLARWVRSPGSNERSRTPTSAYRHSRNLTVMVGLGFGLTLALASGLAVWRTTGPTVTQVSRLPLSLAGGLAVWLAVGLSVALAHEPAWFGFVVTSRWLTFRGKLPWRVMGFLDDAHRLGLLRTAGAVYQFRHAELQDHLARSEKSPAPGQSKRR